MSKNKFINTEARGFSFRGLSMQQRLPLLICILLLSIIVAFSWASYVGVKRASLAIANDRLLTLTEQLSTMFGQSALAIINSTHEAAIQEPVREYLLSGGKTPDSPVLAALQKLQIDTQSLYVELLDHNRRPVFRAGNPGIQVDVSTDSVLSNLQLPPDSCGVGKIYRVKDRMYYPIVATVTDKKQTIGYIIRWRSTYATLEAINQFSQLLGTKAALYIGNTDGRLWTDLTKPVNPPPVDNILAASEAYFDYSRPQASPVIARARPVANTQWMLLLEFSQQTILEGAKRFLSWLLIIGGLITAIGITLAWIMSRNITQPLKKLTAAATTMASGNYKASVEVARKDELGELAYAFNSMAVQIANAHNDLEQKVQERTAQLETVNKELEAFTYSISHDLRAPLRGIIGFTTILEEDYSSKLDDEAKRITSVIKTNTIKMGHLIDGLLTFSRMERKDIVKIKIHTNVMVNEVIEQLREQNAGSNLQWNIQPLPDINGDANTIRQVWVNLISNAIKYSAKRELPCIEIGTTIQKGKTFFYIKDNGVGFDEQYKDKLFKVFQRLHGADEFEGTGIGLALVEKIVSKHGGIIWGEGEKDKGASFYFSLPAE